MSNTTREQVIEALVKAGIKVWRSDDGKRARVYGPKGQWLSVVRRGNGWTSEVSGASSWLTMADVVTRVDDAIAAAGFAPTDI